MAPWPICTRRGRWSGAPAAQGLYSGSLSAAGGARSGADFVLLIAAALTPHALAALVQETYDLGLEAMVEINTEREAQLATELGAPLVGINNRDLHTFVVDMTTTGRLRPLLPDDVVVAALSGIKSAADGRAMRDCGADAVLVGEALVRAADPAVLLAELGAIP